MVARRRFYLRWAFGGSPPKVGDSSQSPVASLTRGTPITAFRIMNALLSLKVSPVRNTYDSLWHEYCTTDNPETLMIVIWQILEYYFMQMIGCQNVDLRRNLLDKYEKDFVRILYDGSENRDDYVEAATMRFFSILWCCTKTPRFCGVF